MSDIYIPPHKRNQQPPQQQFSQKRSSLSGHGSKSSQSSSSNQAPASDGLVRRNNRWTLSDDDAFKPKQTFSRDPRDRYVDGLWPRNTDRERELFGNVNNDGLDFSAYDDIKVERKGTNLPDALKGFDDIDIGPVVKNNLALAGFAVPTPIQKHALPIILDGRDMMACV